MCFWTYAYNSVFCIGLEKGFNCLRAAGPLPGESLLLTIKSQGVSVNHLLLDATLTQSAFTCSKLAIETLEQGVKYVQS